MPSYQQYLQQVKAQVHEVSPSQLQQHPPQLILDVREPDEHQQGIIPGAVPIPRGQLEGRIESLASSPETEMVVYCAAGSRSALAVRTLQQMGYQRVSSLQGGITAWRSAGFPVEQPLVFTAAQRSRYARHIMLPEVGEAGQAKLLKSRVLLVGAGGLGSPAGYYLAAAGVGTLGIVDDDVVDESNLQRQILHNTTRVGRPKVESARQTLSELNPDVQVITHRTRLQRDNAIEILRGYDVIIDGADNFPTRYLLSDASLLLRIPVVHASIDSSPRFCRGKVRAIAVCILSRRRQTWLRRATKRESSECCPVSSVCCKRRKRSRSCSEWARRCRDGWSSTKRCRRSFETCCCVGPRTVGCAVIRVVPSSLSITRRSAQAKPCKPHSFCNFGHSFTKKTRANRIS